MSNDEVRSQAKLGIGLRGSTELAEVRIPNSDFEPPLVYRGLQTAGTTLVVGIMLVAGGSTFAYCSLRAMR